MDIWDKRQTALAAIREKEKLQTREDLKSKTYEKDGALYWKSNDAPVPMDVFLAAVVPPPKAQGKACQEHTDKFLAEYRKAMENYVHTDEEMAEMRAAFGPGIEVMNVVTGKKVRT